MNYDIKKLSEVEALTEVPEGANMIAEVGGQIKRVPAVTGEGGGSGGGGDIVVASGKSLIIEDGATVSDVGGALYIAINNATEGLLGYVIQKVLQGGSQKTLVSINPDNSCSMSFSEVSELVENGNAAFEFTMDALVGAPIQSSWTSSTRINGEVQSAIHAHILVVTENALKVRILLWGEKSGISVTSKTLSFS